MNRNYIYTVCFFLFFSCHFEPEEFDYSCSVDKSEYTTGETLRLDINGGLNRSLIYPVLARLQDGQVIPLYNTWNSGIDKIYNDMAGPHLPDEFCCDGQGGDGTPNNGSPYSSSRFICNCDLPSKIEYKLGFEYSFSGWISDDYFQDCENYDWKVYVLDPFIDETGAKTESTNYNVMPNSKNVLAESDIFSITSVSSSCSFPIGLQNTGYFQSWYYYLSFDWDPVIGADRYEVSYKRVDESSWVNEIVTNNSIYIGTISDNIQRQVKLRTICDVNSGESSSWSPVQIFDVAECATPTNLYNSGLIDKITVHWDDMDVYKYEFAYRCIPNTEWTTYTTYNTTRDIPVFVSTDEFEVRVRSICSQFSNNNEIKSEWSSIETYKLPSPCNSTDCSSLSQLSDYEAYTGSGSSSWSSEWTIASTSGHDYSSCFSTQGNYCVGGYIEFDINLSVPSVMTYYGRRGGFSAQSAQITVDGSLFSQTSTGTSGSSWNNNYFGHYKTNNLIPAGSHTIRLEFPSSSTYNNYYIDDIIFYCQ